MSARRFADLLGDLIDGGFQRPVELLDIVAAARGGQQHAETAESLERLIVELARPPPALLLGGPQGPPQTVLLHRLGGRDRGRRARGGGEQQTLVIGAELGATLAVERLDHTEAHAAEQERHEHPGLRLDTEVAEREPQRVADITDPLGASGADDASRDRAGPRDPAADDPARDLPRGRRDDELVTVDEQDRRAGRLDERA